MHAFWKKKLVLEKPHNPTKKTRKKKRKKEKKNSELFNYLVDPIWFQEQREAEKQKT